MRANTAVLSDPPAVRFEPPSASDAGEVFRQVLLGALEDPLRGVILIDSGGRVAHATDNARKRLGVPPGHELRGAALADLLSGFNFDPDSLAQALDAGAQGEDVPEVRLRGAESRGGFLLRLRDLGHGYRSAVLEPTTVDDGQVGPVAAALAVAQSDPLTGLANRSRFEEATAAALDGSGDGCVAVLMLDLDRFKAVNDTLGHGAGDALLRLVAERLQVAVRQADVVSRFGGDEFAVLLAPIQEAGQASDVATRILDLVHRSYLLEGQVANIGVSIGIAMAPVHGTDGRGLLGAADLALYEAKRSGRATFRFFDPLMRQRALDRRANEMDLRRALALRQFELFYQPQVSVGGRLVGFEALLRWRHPSRGLVPPADFIPLAERIGAIVPIGDWVLRSAVKEALKWPEDVVIAVNVSPLQLHAEGFVPRVRRLLVETRLPGRRLEIEITESMLVNRPEEAIRILNELRGEGVRIAMDDFGTGYASLSQLALFPFDKIKVDRSLTGADGADIKKRAIIRAITALGQTLGVCTLAEGVELEQQLEHLASDGCSSVQGYLVSKPVPASQVGDLIARLHSPGTAADEPPSRQD